MSKHKAAMRHDLPSRHPVGAMGGKHRAAAAGEMIRSFVVLDSKGWTRYVAEGQALALRLVDHFNRTDKAAGPHSIKAVEVIL